MKSLAVLAILFTLFFLGSRTSVDAQPQTILEILRTRFTGLYNVVSNFTAIANALNSTGNFTLFAPVNSIFPPNVDASVLQYHLSPNFYSSTMLTDQLNINSSLVTAALGNRPQVLIVSRLPGTNPTVNNINIISNSSDIYASNGIIHGIGNVLFPPLVNASVLLSSLGYSHTSALIPLSSFSIESYPGITVLAATDAGWSKETRGLYEYLALAGQPQNTTINVQARADLDLIIRYNSIGSPVYSADLGFGTTTAPTLLAGETLMINKPNGWPNQTLVVNAEANVTSPNILIPNGVIHGIDDALLPSTFNFNLEKVLYGVNATSFLNAMMATGTYNLILNDSQPRTLFVPMNFAFANISTLTREQVLYHVVPQVLATSDSFQDYLVSSMSPLNTLPGNDTQKLLLTIEKVNTTNILDLGVNGQTITVQSKTTNGNVVYLIDAVLSLPGAVPAVAAQVGLSNFSGAVNALGLDYNLASQVGVTVFAPTDDAFGNLPPGTLEYLLMNDTDSTDALNRIVENHIVRNPSMVFYSYAIPNGTSMIQNGIGQALTVVKGGRSITVDGANVSDDDAAAANGVVHLIDKVLVPSDIVINLIDILEGLGNFNTLLQALNATSLTNAIAFTNDITLFAPNDYAFSQVEDLASLQDNTDELTGVLQNHLVMEAIPALYVNSSYNVGTPNGNSSIVVIGDMMIELRTDDESKGTASVKVSSKATGQVAYLYGIDQVLGVPQKSSSSGLKPWQIALIVVGGVIVGLLILAVAGVLVYFLFFRHRSGYRRINDQNE